MGVRLFVLCLLILVNATLCYKAVWGENGLINHGRLKEQQFAAEEECRQLDDANRALSREIRLLQTDNVYVERMIRERLHYLRDNEILYLFDDTDTASGGSK